MAYDLCYYFNPLFDDHDHKLYFLITYFINKLCLILRVEIKMEKPTVVMFSILFIVGFPPSFQDTKPWKCCIFVFFYNVCDCKIVNKKSVSLKHSVGTTYS